MTNPQDDWADKFAYPLQYRIEPKVSEFVIMPDFLCRCSVMLKMCWSADETRIADVIRSPLFLETLKKHAEDLIQEMVE